MMSRNSGWWSNRSTSHSHHLFSILFLLTALLIFPFHEGHCAQITLAWDPDSLSDLLGYKIYYGTSPGNYQWNIDVGNVTTYALSGLTVGTTYYAAATAYVTSGFESAYSNEVMFTVPSCTYAISPSNAAFAASGGTGSVSITTQPYCNWTSSSSTPWMTINTGSGLGSGTMSYSVFPNTGETTQTASMTIAGNVFTVTEAGQGQTVYIITASADTGGSISPSGQVAVRPGAGQTFMITPNTGYKLANVKVDGVSRGQLTSYTFSNVQANHTINASFTAVTANNYTLSINTNGTGNGSVSSNLAGTVFSSGTGVTLTVTPGPNSVFGGWSGGCSGVSTTCQVTMNSNINVTATFTAISDSPNVITDSPTSVVGSLATLNGTVNPNGLATTYFFEWGTTTSYGIASSNRSAGGGASDVPVSANLTGLTPNTTYHYRLVAKNSAGTSNGADATFFTGIAGFDFDGDGKADILWRNAASGEVYFWQMNGMALSGQGSLGTVDPGWEIKGIGDFDGNGKTDILWRNAASGEVYLWQMNGMTLTGRGSLGAVDPGWEIKGVGDFNGEGKADILWRNKATGEVFIWLMNGTAIASAGFPGTVSDLNWEIKGVGDFNGEGKADILWRNKATGEVFIWLMNGTAIASAGSPGTVSDLNWEIQCVGDFNGEGKADICWRNKATGEVFIWLMNGTAIASSGSPGSMGDTNWEIVAP